MVLQVRPDTGRVAHDRYAQGAQMVGRSDAREHQQLRRSEGAG
jgi:hypothetical protein